MKKPTLGCCLYTVSADFEKAPFDTLYRLADMGYEAVEIGGYTALTTLEWQGMMRKTGLRVSSVHMDMHVQEQQTRRVMEFANEVGCRYIGYPCLRRAQDAKGEDYLREAESMNRIGKIYRENGFTLMYHNHSFEFQRFDGKYGLDILMENTDPADVHFQIDTYWIAHGKEDPIDYIQKCAGRIHVLHCKDMAEDGFFAPVGEGTLDFPGIVKAARQAGVHTFLVEQDAARRPAFDCAQSSCTYLSGLLAE